MRTGNTATEENATQLPGKAMTETENATTEGSDGHRQDGSELQPGEATRRPIEAMRRQGQRAMVRLRR